MKYNISKELFEAVMGIKCQFYEIGYCSIFNQYTIYFGEILDAVVCDSISIDSFFFKCIDYLQKNNINIELNTNSDLKADVFKYIDNLIK